MERSERIEKAEKAFREFMEALDLDFKDDNFTNTPHRVAKMFVNETCRGLFEDLKDIKVTSFDNKNNYK